MARKTYDQDPPAHFNKIFVRCCMNCAGLKWTMKHWYVCTKHRFKFNKHGSLAGRQVCGSWEINPDLLEMWRKQK